MSNRITLNSVSFDASRLADEDTLTIERPSTRPLGFECGDSVTLIDMESGDVYIGIVEDTHDCWIDGGEPSYIYVSVC
jgi:hypothetical protein